MTRFVSLAVLLAALLAGAALLSPTVARADQSTAQSWTELLSKEAQGHVVQKQFSAGALADLCAQAKSRDECTWIIGSVLRSSELAKIISRSSPDWCAADGMDVPTAYFTWLLWLDKHPAFRSWPVADSIIAALGDAGPCAKRK